MADKLQLGGPVWSNDPGSEGVRGLCVASWFSSSRGICCPPPTLNVRFVAPARAGPSRPLVLLNVGQPRARRQPVAALVSGGVLLEVSLGTWTARRCRPCSQMSCGARWLRSWLTPYLPIPSGLPPRPAETPPCLSIGGLSNFRLGRPGALSTFFPDRSLTTLLLLSDHFSVIWD